MKDSFILFTEYKEQIDMLSDEQAGVLLKAIFCYSAGEILPQMDSITKMAFSFIRAALDRTDDKYQRKVESNRENGRLGGRPPKNKEQEGEKKQEETQNNPNKPKKPNGYLGFEVKTKKEPQKPNGYFENPPEPEREPERKSEPECDSERDSEPEQGGGDRARAREAAALDRFCERWGISANAIGNYSGGKLSGMDWDKVSEKVATSSVLRQRRSISFFIRNYEKILDGEFDDWDDKPPGREKKKDSDFDGSRFANIEYE